MTYSARRVLVEAGTKQLKRSTRELIGNWQHSRTDRCVWRLGWPLFLPFAIAS